MNGLIESKAILNRPGNLSKFKDKATNRSIPFIYIQISEVWVGFELIRDSKRRVSTILILILIVMNEKTFTVEILTT